MYEWLPKQRWDENRPLIGGVGDLAGSPRRLGPAWLRPVLAFIHSLHSTWLRHNHENVSSSLADERP